MGKTDNRGMSLVEIIVVLAFMAIIAGLAGYGLNLISNKPVHECVKKIEMALNRNRTNSMGKKEAWVEFFLDDGRVTVVEHTLSGRDGAAALNTDPVHIGDKDVRVRFIFSDDSFTDLQQDPSGRVRIAFTRDSGALSDAYGPVCTQIVVFTGTFSSPLYKQTIKLETLTGKVTVE